MEAPDHLSDRCRNLWSTITGGFTLEPTEVELPGDPELSRSEYHYLPIQPSCLNAATDLFRQFSPGQAQTGLPSS
jgi:hypothetical protein